ncbi:electron transfer flavoprotein subunit alpha [Candidatus Geothermarchaeota archaeon ex4572_27]|nr:MAG: electron transfer flavoprotein subunit alpha [Candidatus Geothermarchaeota archaeon ex4572_27]
MSGREALIVAEHRAGELREVSYELASIARRVADRVACALLGYRVDGLAEELARYVDQVLYVDSELLKEFNSEVYLQALLRLVEGRGPWIVLMGHTSIGMELAAPLAIRAKAPLVTDCVDLKVAGDRLSALRQVYGGKVLAEVELGPAERYVATIRPGSVGKPSPREPKGEVVRLDLKLEEPKLKRTIGYIEPPPTEVDITKADIIVSIGRGVRDQKDVPAVEELARMLGGVLACSRPIVDKGWLPKDRQVGSSGKTVKPKLYLALGISGAFQHVMGMKDSELIIAVNKDPNAPIFNVAHYGVVDDLLRVVEALKERLRSLKA